jgi:alanine dehydrogenase
VSVIPVLSHDAVLAAVSPQEAIARTRDAFVRHHAREWSMPPKVYLESPGHGDFRAMPARGDGLAMLKWISSFPGNPERGLPTVMGVVVLSDAATSAPVGCGLHGAWAARCLAAAGYGPGVCSDPRADVAQALADELGWEAGDRAAALACDVVCCVTPGAEAVVDVGDLRPGLHLNMLGADGPGKAEATVAAVIACSLFCDEWAQASHGGELTAAVEQGLVTRDLVTDLGAVLAGESAGRPHAGAVTLFDSTGLAIQDLAIAGAAYHAWRAGDVEATTVEL